MVITPSATGERLGIAGELDVLTAPVLIDAARSSLPSSDLTLDLSRVVFIDAAGLSGLIQVRRELASTGRRLRIVGATPRVARTFVLAGVAGLLTPGPDPVILDELTAVVLQAAPKMGAAYAAVEPHRPRRR
jgi:anti-sigma B factor antagonist